MSSVMDNRSNWLFWQVPPSSFISNCWDWQLQFFCSKRPCEQIWVGGCCCDREVLKEKGLCHQEHWVLPDGLPRPLWKSATSVGGSRGQFQTAPGLPGYLGDHWAFQAWCYCLSESSQQRNMTQKEYFLLIVFFRSCEYLCISVITRVDLSGNNFEISETWKQVDVWFIWLKCLIPLTSLKVSN